MQGDLPTCHKSQNPTCSRVYIYSYPNKHVEIGFTKQSNISTMILYIYIYIDHTHFLVKESLSQQRMGKQANIHIFNNLSI